MGAAMFSIAGGHWAILQTIAWAEMLSAFSQRDGVAEAMVKTFDGAHPCALCCKVKEMRAKERKAPIAIKQSAKANVFTAEPAELASGFHFGRSFAVPVPAFPFFRRSEAPPRPVPIA